MDAQDEHPQADQAEQGDQPELNDLGKLAFHFVKYGQNATNNLSATFGDMTAEQWLRIVVIVGAYLLLRPQIIRFLNKRQVAQMEEADAKAKAEISPNELRGGKAAAALEEEEDTLATGAEWGGKARTRQRAMIKQLMEEEERRKAEEEEDKDIADFLED